MKNFLSLAVYGIVAMAIFSATTANAATNLIVNGGFEQPAGVATWIPFKPEGVPGWSGSDAVEIWNSSKMGVTPYEGVQHAELNSHGIDNHYADGVAPFSLYQEIATTAGQTYQLSFAYRARSSSDESFWVGASTDTIFEPTGNDASSSWLMDDHVTGQWSTFTDTFVATSSLSTVYFLTLNPTGTVGNFVDNVSVSAVPVPAAVWLFGSAFAGLIGFGRRKTKF